METNIDDCSGEMLGFVMEQLLDQGALDVFFTSIFMKKNRPAYRLTVVCNEEKMDLLQKVIFTQTTTIGIRYRKEQRTVLKRQINNLRRIKPPLEYKDAYLKWQKELNILEERYEKAFDKYLDEKKELDNVSRLY